MAIHVHPRVKNVATKKQSIYGFVEGTEPFGIMRGGVTVASVIRTSERFSLFIVAHDENLVGLDFMA